MIKRIFAAAACLFFALAISIFSFFYVRRTCEALESRTLQALQAADPADPAVLREAIELADYYTDDCGWLRFLLGRKDIDTLQAKVEAVSLFAEQGDILSLRQALTELAVCFRVLSDGEIPKSENIF